MKFKRQCKGCGNEISKLFDYCLMCKNKMEKADKPINTNVCRQCGEKYGEKKAGALNYELNCWKEGECFVCKKNTQVTHYRLYGYLINGVNEGRLKF